MSGIISFLGFLILIAVLLILGGIMLTLVMVWPIPITALTGAAFAIWRTNVYFGKRKGWY